MNFLVGLVILSVVMLLQVGCVTVRPESLPPQRTKSELRTVLTRKPDKIISSAGGQSLKHEADELWVFAGPSTTEDRYYFKGEELVAVDHVIYETW